MADSILDSVPDDDLQAMQKLAETTQIPIPNNLAKVWDLPVLHQDVIAKDDMENYVKAKVEDEFYDRN